MQEAENTRGNCLAGGQKRSAKQLLAKELRGRFMNGLLRSDTTRATATPSLVIV